MERRRTAGLHQEEEKEKEKEKKEEKEGGEPKDLVLRWFAETQANLLLHDGNFPDWFHGFSARKDAEDLLRDKDLGSFLIRLSDKAFGYILSYKGFERCRHFIITVNEVGRLVITGEDQTYGSLMELIQHYKLSPIQPFGEYLTSACHLVDADEIYDVVNVDATRRSGVSVQALRTLWDQNDAHNKHKAGIQRVQKQNGPNEARPPALPPKSSNKKLTATVSAGEGTKLQRVPMVPKRGSSLDSSPSGSSFQTTSAETATASQRAERHRGTPEGEAFNTGSSSSPGDTDPPHSEHTVNRKCSPLGSAHISMREAEEEEEEEEGDSNQPSSSSFKPSPPVALTVHTYSLSRPGRSHRSSRSEQRETLRSNPLYESTAAPQGGVMYVEVAQRTAERLDNPYEQIPGESSASAAAGQSNTYEAPQDTKTKKSKSTLGKHNIKWKKFLSDHKKK